LNDQSSRRGVKLFRLHRIGGKRCGLDAGSRVDSNASKCDNGFTPDQWIQALIHMKKILIRSFIALIILLILGVVAIGLFLDGAVKRGVETVGPMLTKVDVKVDSVNLSLLSGGGKIKGLFIGNPAGYKTPSAIQVGNASLAIVPGSIFSSKVIIRSINVQAPEITFETDLKGNNLSKIVANLEAFSGDSSHGDTRAQAKASKKLQVDDFLISGGKINATLAVLGSQSTTVPLPEIHLTALGQGPDGITAAELTKLVLEAVEKEAVRAAASAVGNLSKDAANLTKGFGTAGTGAVDTVTRGIGGLFQKK
jgi:hypothetical protein